MKKGLVQMRSLLASVAISIAALCATTANADARLLVVGNQTPSSFSVFTLGDAGQLSPVAGSPFSSSTQEPRSLIISPDGTRLYAGHRTVDMVSQRTIAADGSLTTLAPDLPFGSATQTPAISPGSSSLYLSSGTNNANLRQFSIATDGALTAGASVQILSNGADVAITPDGKFMYVCSSTKGLFGFSLANDGTPTALTDFPQMSFGCTSAAITPNGRFLLTGQNGWGLRVAAIAADGTLTKIGTEVSTGPAPYHLAIAPDGRSAYMLNVGSPGAGANVAAFTIGEDGTASHVGTDQTITAAGV